MMSCGARCHLLHLPAMGCLKVWDEMNCRVCRRRAHEEIIHLAAVNDCCCVSVRSTGIMGLFGSCPWGTYPCYLSICILGPRSEFIPELSELPKLHLAVHSCEPAGNEKVRREGLGAASACTLPTFPIHCSPTFLSLSLSPKRMYFKPSLPQKTATLRDIRYLVQSQIEQPTNLKSHRPMQGVLKRGSGK